eukprot:gene629-828_t
MYGEFFVSVCLSGGTAVFFDGLIDLMPSDGHAIDLVSGVPTVLGCIELPTSAHTVMCGGEAITESVAELIHPHLQLNNIYGPTETQWMISKQYGSLVDFTISPASIGRPMANNTCFVVHPVSMVLQPVGVYGELLVGGVQVMQGYVNREKLTTEKFIRNLWPSTDPSGRDVVYRTGDLVRWYDDGELEFAGRIDFQVKLRGYRIELGEIENILRTQEGVTEAVVLVREDVGTDSNLVAYVYPASLANDINLLKRVLCVALPSYMVPSFFVGIDEWPRTSSGKIDRKRLPPPDQHLDNFTMVAPRSESEILIRDVFADVLGLDRERVSVESSFFDLGGNSLSAVRLVTKLQQSDSRFCGILATDVFAHPTVASLAQIVNQHDSLQKSENRLPLIAVVCPEEDVEYPVSWNQSQLLTVH